MPAAYPPTPPTTTSPSLPPAPHAWQYPGEAELTFPPFTCLEANGEPRLERTSDGEVVVFPLKVRLERGCLVAGSTIEPISEHGLVYRAWQPPGRHCCRPHLKISSSSVVKLVSEPGMV